MAKKKIDPKMWYSLTDLAENSFLPWLGSDKRRYRRFVALDQKGENHLKAMVIGDGKSKRYNFKGEHIINFLKMADKGKIAI